MSLADDLRAIADRHDQADAQGDDGLAYAVHVGLDSWTRNHLREWADHVEQIEGALDRVRAALDDDQRSSVILAAVRAIVDGER